MSSANAAAAYRTSHGGGSVQLAQKHIDLVAKVAGFLAFRLPASVELDDLMQAGMLGLLDASRQYKPEQGASFETYASIRIRGAMIDELRRGDWVPRSVHRQYRTVVEATRKVEQTTGRSATAEEVAAAAGMTVDDYHRAVEDASRGQLLSLEMHVEQNDGEDRLTGAITATPETDFTKDSFRRLLAEGIEGLPPREKLVLSLYYEQELNLREIGAVMQISESRVCQLHGQAVVRLRSRLKDWKIDDALGADAE
jgi:RNA polymerase sigma factor for flagellar operon FliA